MIPVKRNRIILFWGGLSLILLSVIHLFLGEFTISVTDFWDSFFHYNPENIRHKLVQSIRIPRIITTISAGISLSVAGLLMQTLFQNPLAGPYVLGINSGSSLFVALGIMTGIPLLSTNYSIVVGALVGAFVFGLLILLVATVVKNHISLLLIGLMLGSFTGALVSILQTVSQAEEVKFFAIWTMGSLQETTLQQSFELFFVALCCVVCALFVSKSLNLWILGEGQARLLGVNHKGVRLTLIGITAVLTGVITAYCGPIGFVGLVVPNLVKIFFRTQNHQTLLLACGIFGASFLVICDSILQLLAKYFVVPINIFTSLIGAPIVVLLILKKIR